MNAPTRIAQVTGAAGSKPTRVLKIDKPQGGQAITAEASYDGTVKIDFSSIANEKITLVHIGERLIILFDNQSTVTIIPFFDSMGVPLANLTIESNGKEFTGAEFASTFPITTDQSVLPAAGDAAGTPAAGANFSNASVDPLLGPNPLPLLGPEDLPPINFTRIEGPITTEVNLLPSTSENDPVSIDEDDINVPPGFSQGIGNTDSPGDDQPIAVSGVLKFFPGTPPATVDFASMHLDAVEGKDSQGNNLALTSQGHDLVYVWSGDTLKAVWASDESHVVFQIELNPTTGAYTVTLFDQLDHPFTNDPSTPADDATVHGFEDNLIVGLTYTVTDADGQTATGSLKVDFDDDMPHVTGAVESRIVDEDDIKTPWSHGTSPNDGDADGSITENSTGAAFVSGTLSGLVDIGADEVPVEIREQPEGEDTPPAIIGSGIIFSFTADVIAQMEALGLYSKQSTQPATENGLPLTYTTGTSGDWQILSAFEPDAVPGLPDTGNPVFELRINQITGAYEFRLFDELIHQLPPGFPNGSDENFGLRSGEPDPVTGQAIVNGLDFGSIIQVTDYDGDSVTLDGKFLIQIRDDVPHPDIDASHDESVIHDETPGDDGADDVSFGGLPGSAQTAFSGVTNTGNDPDVPSVQLGAIGFAHDNDPIVFNDTSVFGADHPPASQLFSLQIVGGNGVDSGLDITEGNSIFLFLENGVIVGRVQGGPFDGQAAFAVQINQNGEISVAQWLSIKHDDRGDFDESNDNGNNVNDALPNDPLTVQQTLDNKINAVLTITDSDGDSVSDSVGIGDRVIFQDDGPKFTKLEANQDLTHDETPGLQDDDVDVSNVPAAALTAFNAIANHGDDPDVPPATGPIGYAVSSGSILNVQVNYGADGQGAPIAYELVLDGNNIHSGLTTTDGRDIHLFKEGNIIVGRYEVGGNNQPDGSGNEPAAFAIYIDPATGQTTVVQYVSLHHPDTNDFDEEVDIDGGALFVKVTVVDGDGDPLTEYVDIGSKIEFDDDGPSANFTLNSGISVIHDETVGIDGDANDVAPGSLASLFSSVNNKGNDPDESTAPEPEIGYAQSTGPVVNVTGVNFGADGPAAGGAITYAIDVPGVSNSSQSVSSGLFTTDGREIFLFEQNGLVVGRYEDDNFNANAPENDDPAAFAIHVDPTTGVMTVVQYVSIKHDDRGDPDESNDNGNNINDALPNDPLTVQQWIDSGALRVTVSVTDGDGDSVSQQYNIGNKVIFQDDGPSLTAATQSGTVDEDGVLEGAANNGSGDGIAGGPDDVAGTSTVASGNVSSLFLSGVDGPLTLSLVGTSAAQTALSGLGLTSGGVGLSYAVTLSAGVYTLTASVAAGTVFTFALNSTSGAWTFTLVDQLDHPSLDGLAGDNTENELAIALGAIVVATDGDGDSIGSTANQIVITVDDDTPIYVSGSVSSGTVDEDGVLEGAANNGPGDGIAGGTDDVAGTATVATGSVTNLFQSGADEPLSYSLLNTAAAQTALSGLGLTSGGIPLSYAVVLSAGVYTLTASAPAGNTVFTFALNATTGAWTFTLVDQLDHPSLDGVAGDNTENDLTILLGSIVQATDRDGDTVTAASGSISILVDDDTPIYVSGSVSSGTVDEDGVLEGASDNGPGDGIAGGTDDVAGEATVATGSVTNLFQSGADEPLSYSLLNTAAAQTALSGLGLTSGGIPLSYVVALSAGVYTLTATAPAGNTIFTFALDATTGAWTFTLVDQLDHPSLDGIAGDNTENDLTILLGSIVQATDRDGDTVTAAGGSISILVDDDTPISLANAAVTLDEDDIPGENGNPGGPLDTVPAGSPGHIFSGVLGFQTGADEPATVNFASMNGTSQIVNGVTVSFSWNTGSNTLTANDGEENVFQVVVDNTATGAYHIELLNSLRHHPDASADNVETDSTFTLTYTVTDKDGDSVTGSVSLTVDDDTPTMDHKICLVSGGADGADPSDLLYVIPQGAGFTVSVTDIIEDAGFANSLGYYFADASGNPISGGILTDNVGNPVNEDVVFTITPASVPAGAVLIGFFMIPNGDSLNPTLADGDPITFSLVSGVWVASNADGPLASEQDRLLFADRRLNPDDNDADTDPNPFVTLVGAREVNWEDVIDGDNDFNDVMFNVQVCATPNILATVDEDGLAGHTVDGSPSLRPGEVDGSESVVTTGAAGTLTSLVSFGADGPHPTQAISLAVVTTPAATGLTSQGGAVLIVSNGTTLTGYVEQVGGPGFQAGDRAVFTLTVTPAGGYTFTLLDQVDHPTLNGEPGDNSENLLAAPLDLSAFIVAKDGDGDRISLASGTFAVQILDDIPDVNIVDTPNSVSAGQTIHGTWTLAPGADEVASVEVTIGAVTKTLSLAALSNTVVFGAGDGLSAGTLTFDADGEWHFTANSVGANTAVTFSIKVTDGDGDSDTDSQTIQVLDNRSPLTISGSVTGLVEEEHGLPGGVEDTTDANGLDTDENAPNFNSTVTNVTSGNFGSLVLGGIDGTLSYAFESFGGNPPVSTVSNGPLMSNGAPVLFHQVDATTLIGYVNSDSGAGPYGAGDKTIFTLTLSPITGQYTFTLNGPVDHPLHSIEDTIAINLNGHVRVTDSGGPNPDTALLNASITVIDDIPLAKPGTAQAFEQGTVNLMLVIDVSGSMGDNPNVPGFATRLDLAKAALADVLNSANVNEVLIVTFSSSAQSLGWFSDVTAAINAINGLSAGGNTNYDDALLTAMSAYQGNPPSSADATVALFLSDGVPTANADWPQIAGNQTVDGIQADEQGVWENFLTTNGISSFAVGVGSGVNVPNLEPIAFPNGDPNNPVVVTDEGQLSNTLGTIVSNATGNVLTDGVMNDAFGADGGRILSIEVNGTVFTWNGALTVSTSGDPAAPGTTLGTNSFTTTTDNGGKFTFNFATGTWQYGAPTEVSTLTPDEVFQYVIKDNDGDLATSTLTIDLIPVNDSPVISLNAPTANYLDKFGTIAYNNTDGATNWASTPWTESSDNNSASNGTIRVQGGELRLGAEDDSASITRIVNLSGATSAKLTFNFSAVETEDGEAVTVLFAANGVNFVALDTLDTNDANGVKTYNLTGPFAANAAIRFAVNDFSNDSEWITIDDVNVVGSFVPTYTENGAAVDIMDTATIADPDNPPNFNGGSLHVQLTAGSVAGDQLTFTAGATQSAGNVLVGATNVGTVTGYGTANLTITFNTNATDALIETLMHSIGFSSISDNPGTSRTATITFNDGGHTGIGGPKSDVTTVDINVVATNDAPTTVADTVITNVGVSAAVAIPTAWLLANDTDPEGSALNATNFGGALGGSLSGPAGGNITFNDNATLDGSFTYQANDGSLSGVAATVTVDNNSTATTTLIGGAGSQIIIGGGTNDTIRGGAGSDFMNGGAGTDQLDFSDGTAGITFTLVQSATDTVVDLSAAGLGIDTYRNMEGVIGTALDDKLIGSSAADFLSGGNGNDILIGGAGQDTLTGGAGNDFFKLDGTTTANFDIITDFVSSNDTVNFVNFSLANHGVTGAINSIVTATSAATNIAGADLVIYNVTANNADTAAEINTLLDNQTGTFNGGVFVLAYTDVLGGAGNNVALYYDGDADGNGTGATLVAVFSNYTSVTAAGVPNVVADYVSVVNVADPLILDLGAHGLAFTGLGGGVPFDINADGLVDQTAWTTGEDGILVMDLDNSGTIDSGAEIFSPDFAGGGHAGSLAALATLDLNADGRIDASDAAYGSLQVWQDLNHDGVSDAGELSGLAVLGITGINLGATAVNGTVDGQQLLAAGTFNYADGSTGTFAEVAFETILGAATRSEEFQGHVGQGETYLVGANQPPMTIEGFAEGDRLDLSALLDANYAAGDDVEDFIRLQESGGDVTVQVDTNGPSGGANFVDVVTLAGYGTSNADIVRAVFGGQEQQLAS